MCKEVLEHDRLIELGEYSLLFIKRRTVTHPFALALFKEPCPDSVVSNEVILETYGTQKDRLQTFDDLPERSAPHTDLSAYIELDVQIGVGQAYTFVIKINMVIAPLAHRVRLRLKVPEGAIYENKVAHLRFLNGKAIVGFGAIRTGAVSALRGKVVPFKEIFATRRSTDAGSFR